MKLSVSILLFLTIAFLTSASFACSICSCGDPSSSVCKCDEFEVSKGWQFGVDTKYFSKTNDEDGETEKHSQTQFGLGVNYNFNSSLSFFTRLPIVHNQLKSDSYGSHEKYSKSGFGDVEVLGKFRFNKSFSGWYPAVIAALKLPTGKNELKDQTQASGKQSSLDHGGDTNGGRLPEHAQIGTGSLDEYLILSAAHPGDYTWRAEVGYRLNGKNDFEFQYGAVTWLEVSVARNVFPKARLDLGARLRQSAKDKYQAVADNKSGGTILGGTFEARYELLNKLSIFANILAPVYSDLNGAQKENPLWGAGLVLNY